VNMKSTCKDYTKSRKQQQGHLHCFSASTFPVISSSTRQASVAPNCWSCLGILSGTNTIVHQLSPGPTTEFYLQSHASYPLPCCCMRCKVSLFKPNTWAKKVLCN
jgi:hypothetical protein